MPFAQKRRAPIIALAASLLALASTALADQVTGTAGENQGQSQISAATGGVTVCDTATATPTDVVFPAREGTRLSDVTNIDGEPLNANPTYGEARLRQAPMAVRLGARLSF